MPRNHRPVFDRESMPWARDVDGELDDLKKEVKRLTQALSAASRKATANASGTQRRVVGAVAEFRHPDSDEHVALEGDIIAFRQDGRATPLGSIDAQPREDSGPGRAMTFVSAWDESTGERYWVTVGATGNGSDTTVPVAQQKTVDLFARTGHVTGLYAQELRVGTSVKMPLGQGGSYRHASGVLPFGGGMPAGGTFSFSVLFPVGRFTEIPVVTQSISRPRVSVGIYNENLNGFSVLLENWSGGNEPEDFVLKWHATQASPTAGAG